MRDLITGFLVLFMACGAAADEPLPGTPSALRLGELLEIFNTGDHQALLEPSRYSA